MINWVEVILAAILGLVLRLMGEEQLGHLTWIVGLFLGLSRLTTVRIIRQELATVHKLAKVVDVSKDSAVTSIRDLLALYLQIVEPEFKIVKDGVISDASEKLLALAHEKTSGELATGEYYNWLLPFIERSLPGSRIWAVSMMLDSEWDDSPAERRFLKANIEAAERGVEVDRVFVVPQEIIGPALLANPGINAHLKRGGKDLKGSLVVRDWLVAHDSALLRDLGDGLIAFDKRVALIDFAKEGEIRGRLTMNEAEITRLMRLFQNLKVHSRDLSEIAGQIAPAKKSRLRRFLFRRSPASTEE
jgi:hypothetical protein